MFKALLLFFSLFFINYFAQHSEDAILGRWMAVDKSVAVNVYKEGNIFKAKVVWFDVNLGDGTPIDMRRDVRNPQENLRNRKILGMDILENLKYNPKDKRWENGKIYDASSGRTWDTFAEIKPDGRLFVRGFWKFTWIGKTLYFKRF